MALINCPECSREISDKVKACPHCGYPMVEEQLSSNIVAEIQTVSSVAVAERPKSKTPIIVIAGIILIALLGGIVFYTTSIIPKNKYTEAIALLEQGKYDQGIVILDTIESYKDVPKILEQIKYESKAYNCINELKKYLKNPDSYSPYEIEFYLSSEKSEESTESEESENLNPTCIMHYGAQNGFGGNTAGYAIFYYSKDKSIYQIFGTTNTLDESKLDKDDDDYLWDSLTITLINTTKETNSKIGDIDMARLKAVLKNDAYSTIKIIN